MQGPQGQVQLLGRGSRASKTTLKGWDFITCLTWAQAAVTKHRGPGQLNTLGFLQF